MQIRALGLGAHQGAGDDETNQGLLHQLLSAGSFRVVRMSGDDFTTSRRAWGEDDPSEEDSEPGNQDHNEDPDDNEVEYGYWGRPHAKTPKWFPPVTEPQEPGLKLLMGGEFGRIGVQTRSRKGSASFAKSILSRRSKLRPIPKQDITSVRTVYISEISLSVLDAGHHPEY